MSRRAFLISCVAAALLAGAPALAAEPFKPTRISVTIRGSGPDVILVPGLAAPRSVWNSTVAAVPGYRYHLVQVLGFAGTPAGGNASGPVAAPVADEIARYIRAQGLNRPAMVGHSMGGSIALMVAARHPGVVGKAMVVDMVPAASRIGGFSAPAVRPFAKLIGREYGGIDRIRRELHSIAGRFGNADWLASNNDAGVVGRSIEELIATDLTPELPRIRVPLTVVYACPEPLALSRPRIDRFYAAAYARRPGARLVAIPKSGHTIMADQPAAFQNALKAFLR
ncbi:MAG TPA: alpha/beta hydrolase [Allosphingosinicella sp.]